MDSKNLNLKFLHNSEFFVFIYLLIIYFKCIPQEFLSQQGYKTNERVITCRNLCPQVLCYN